MRVAVISANCGNFDPPPQHVAQTQLCDFHHFTDENYPRRTCAMSARMQARIPKLFGWSMVKGLYDYYLWVDASLALSNTESVTWFIQQLGTHEMAFFRHPDRKSQREEWDFIKSKIAAGNSYLTPRYAGEDGDGALAEIERDPGYEDTLLIATSAFIYRATPKVQELMKEWWYWVSRWHVVDQLGLPYELYCHEIDYTIIEEHYMSNPWLTPTRKRRKA
jgi:hypothetical protein